MTIDSLDSHTTPSKHTLQPKYCPYCLNDFFSSGVQLEEAFQGIRRCLNEDHRDRLMQTRSVALLHSP